MMLRLLALYLLAAAPAFGETLLAGAIYFDSRNTLLEVADMLKMGDTNGLANLFKGNHISEKLPKDLDIILLFSSNDPGSPVEFRFANDPTTYWTYGRYVTAKGAKAAFPPGMPETADLAPTITTGTPIPGLKPTPTPFVLSVPTPATPLPSPSPPAPSPTPSPTPKTRLAAASEAEEGDNEARPPMRKRYRAKEHAPAKDPDEEVPASAKVWHLVNGHLKWYDKRNYHEVRRALPVAGGATPVPVPYLNPSPTPYVSPRALVP